jgi:acyl-coenzyme A synthetase/AMP-(fatty) acid ligase
MSLAVMLFSGNAHLKDNSPISLKIKLSNGETLSNEAWEQAKKL